MSLPQTSFKGAMTVKVTCQVATHASCVAVSVDQSFSYNRHQHEHYRQDDSATHPQDSCSVSHEARLVQRGLPVSQHQVTIFQMPVHNLAIA